MRVNFLSLVDYSSRDVRLKINYEHLTIRAGYHQTSIIAEFGVVSSGNAYYRYLCQYNPNCIEYVEQIVLYD